MDFTKIKKNLEKKGYEVSTFSSKEEAVDYLSGKIDGKTVGMGGSVTIQEMGLFDKLADHNDVFWHWRLPEGMTVEEVRQRQMTTEIFITSANGIAESGELMNIDGSGNRVSASIFGHEKVYFVIGSNKIRPTFEEAYERMRNNAGPKNAHRLGVKTPCAKRGDKCYNCQSPERICRVFTSFWCCPNGQPCEVVLIDEPLGY
ncbi:MAG: lactate utilization protein [Anaerovoracaceae bacterium]|jgi:L-lactate utilization protein LutB